MTLAHLIAFNLTLLAAIASPGPSLLFLTRTTLAHGRAAGIAVALGLGTMAATWTLMALLGLQTLFALFPFAYVALKAAGALYLIWIALQTWIHAHAPLGQAAPVSHQRFFASGLLVNLGNPKSVLFAAAVLLVIFPADLTTSEKAFIFANHLIVEWTVQPALAVLLSTSAIRHRYLGAKPLLDRIAATVLGALGLRLLIEK
ncbi:LysE family translocator [Marimonas arenosa]|uniref:LysE family translocator n=1 Tax=Marimonas arenosa TaxID=1795305 RepID=A0AAE3W986_9RHOB|nr:LysE family transporter [Marimonas arenosa]MDQ2088554.1 LysE family translocator [Marimonas arenosa]